MIKPKFSHNRLGNSARRRLRLYKRAVKHVSEAYLLHCLKSFCPACRQQSIDVGYGLAGGGGLGTYWHCAHCQFFHKVYDPIDTEDREYRFVSRRLRASETNVEQLPRSKT